MTPRTITVSLLGLYAGLTVYSAAAQPLVLAAAVTGFAFALLHAAQREGWRRALLLLALVFVVSLLFESVGVATGLVYGPYHYTDVLGPKFLGLVPYLIPVAWFMMSYPSLVIAEWLTFPGGRRSGRSSWRQLVAVAAVGGLVMTAWDIVMDPLMVAGGHWVWDTEGAYFGIPLQNFVGWWLTVFTTFALYLLVRGKQSSAPDAGFDRLAVASYLVTAAGAIITSLANDAGDLALIGFFVMLPWGILAWMRTGARTVAATDFADVSEFTPDRTKRTEAG